MVAKLIAIIMTCAAVGSTTLAVRQQTLVAANTMIDIHRTLERQEEALWRLHCEITSRTRPSTVLLAIGDENTHNEVLFDWCRTDFDPTSEAAWPGESKEQPGESS